MADLLNDRIADLPNDRLSALLTSLWLLHLMAKSPIHLMNRLYVLPMVEWPIRRTE